MARIFEFPLDNMSEKDKKIIRLETYIRSNLIELAEKRKELVALQTKLMRSQIRLVKNESSNDKENK